jgi:hypothetical protein
MYRISLISLDLDFGGFNYLPNAVMAVLFYFKSLKYCCKIAILPLHKNYCFYVTWKLLLITVT